MAPRMSLLPLICSLSGETLMVKVSTGKCMARGVTMAVTLFASRSRIACDSSGNTLGRQAHRGTRLAACQEAVGPL